MSQHHLRVFIIHDEYNGYVWTCIVLEEPCQNVADDIRRICDNYSSKLEEWISKYPDEETRPDMPYDIADDISEFLSENFVYLMYNNDDTYAGHCEDENFYV